MKKRSHTIKLAILPSEPYKAFLEVIAHDYAGVSDNIAYHLSYLEYLYQLLDELPLTGYRVLNGLRIKTIIGELASCAEVLLYDGIVNLAVTDSWGGEHVMALDKKVGFAVLLKYALDFGIVDRSLYGRLHRLFELRHKIHLTHRKRDPYEFTDSLLKDSERTLEDLFRHFVAGRQRKVRGRGRITPDAVVLPWKRVHSFNDATPTRRTW